MRKKRKKTLTISNYRTVSAKIKIKRIKIRICSFEFSSNDGFDED